MKRLCPPENSGYAEKRFKHPFRPPTFSSIIILVLNYHLDPVTQMSTSVPTPLSPKQIFANYIDTIRNPVSNISPGNSFFTLLANVLSHDSVHVVGFYDIARCHTQAVIEFDDMYVSLSYNQDGVFQALLANSTNKQLQQIVISNGNASLVELSPEERITIILDLDFNGRRWEGFVKNGSPFGYGCLYDEEGNLEYEGFILNRTYTCYGKHYYGGIECLSYAGGYCDGKRCGKGISYDRCGEQDFDGNWYDNCKQKRLTNSLSQFPLLFITLERLSIPSQYSQGDAISTLVFSPLLVHLQSIEIGESCFPSIQHFVVDGLASLEFISIGNLSLQNPSFNKENEFVFQIIHCPKLYTISLGQSVGYAMNIAELNDLPSLKEVSMSKYCFLKTRSFSLMRT